jgi:hypothetical protein
VRTRHYYFRTIWELLEVAVVVVLIDSLALCVLGITGEDPAPKTLETGGCGPPKKYIEIAVKDGWILLQCRSLSWLHSSLSSTAPDASHIPKLGHSYGIGAQAFFPCST